VQRREFFSSFAKAFKREEPKRLYPPYYLHEDDFEKCRECEAKGCASACEGEEGIIRIVDGVPSLDFSKSGCSFCDACAQACEEGVLKVEWRRRLPPVRIDPIGCLAWHHTICSSCKEACLERAIDFAGLFRPEVNERCTGCGFCVGVCPAGAIETGGEA